jgi:hypothetical protein
MCFAPKKPMKIFLTSITLEPLSQNMSSWAFWKDIRRIEQEKIMDKKIGRYFP